MHVAPAVDHPRDLVALQERLVVRPAPAEVEGVPALEPLGHILLWLEALGFKWG